MRDGSGPCRPRDEQSLRPEEEILSGGVERGGESVLSVGEGSDRRWSETQNRLVFEGRPTPLTDRLTDPRLSRTDWD